MWMGAIVDSSFLHFKGFDNIIYYGYNTFVYH